MTASASGKSLLLGNLEAILNSLAAAITIPFVVPYAVTLGADGTQAGLVTALPLLAINLFQVPAARWGARSTHPHRFLALAGSLSRAAWLALALLMLTGRGNLPALLIVATAASASSGMLWPVWTSFLARHVPEDRRGSYFGTRNLLGGLATLAGTALAAYLVSMFGFTQGYGFALILAVVALAGALATQVVAVGSAGAEALVVELPGSERSPATWRIPAVRRYVGYGALLILGAGISTPFYSVYFMTRLNGSPEMATTMIATANAVTMLAQALWGKVIDRYGLSPVANVSLGIIALSPLFWLAATAPIHGVPIWLVAGLAWAACNLANFNLVLAISNESNRASVVAWISVFQAPADFAAPLIGGLLADRIDLPAVFVISTVVRLAAWGVFLMGFPYYPSRDFTLPWAARRQR